MSSFPKSIINRVSVKKILRLFPSSHAVIPNKIRFYVFFLNFFPFFCHSDLHGQLNRPITESSLLRTAYERHLNRYITNADLCPPLRLKHRWRVCKRLRDRQQSNVAMNSESNCPKCNCRIGIAKAPEFLCCATGFSFRSMVDTVDGTISENSTAGSNGTRESLHEEDGSVPSSFRIADLRPLLYPSK